MKQAILLVNLGSPDSPAEGDVRRYLDEFLMDPLVLDVPAPLRALIVKGFILPKRPAQSAQAYAKIWGSDGSPLIAISQRVRAALEARAELPVGLAMRYGQPSIPQGIEELLHRAGPVDEITVVPLYPHYAMASSQTVEVAVRRALADTDVALRFVPPFYNDPEYLDALAFIARRDYPAGTQHVLFSYHGIPKRHLRKVDPTGSHCTHSVTCCITPSIAHETCYKHQAIETTEELAKRLGLRSGQYSMSFQSRLGGGWVEPFTDLEFAELAKRGVTRLAVICPSFVSDCLETLEEIAMRGRETFLEAGGESFTYLPCLNDEPRWIAALASLCGVSAPAVA